MSSKAEAMRSGNPGGSEQTRSPKKLFTRHHLSSALLQTQIQIKINHVQNLGEKNIVQTKDIRQNDNTENIASTEKAWMYATK